MATPAKTIRPARTWAHVLAVLLVVLCVMPARVLAAVAFTNQEYYLHAGSPFTITWEGNRGPISLALMNGPDENLKEVISIVEDYEGTEYTWTPPADLKADSYILRLRDAGSTDYSPRFKYPVPPVTSTSKVSATPSSTSSSSPSTNSPSTDDSSSSSSTLSTTALAVIGALGGALLLALAGICAYYIAYRKLKRKYSALTTNDWNAGASFGGGINDDTNTAHYGSSGMHGQGMGLPLTPVYGGAYPEHAAAAGSAAALHMNVPSPSSAGGVTTTGSAFMGGTKMEGQYGYQQYQPPTELPERGQIEAELSAEGRHQR
ncbi:hypothetical protein VTJ49DRAFT_5194 [Mycothermus thermophilus]|uniref:Yeast cell wall synthesis Kre9/Knh1-like N-terminal domain-containing protein n=1 Tax=Humicola insolens TaxID=85995 RepID=A0ABR3VKU3_HUMIN